MKFNTLYFKPYKDMLNLYNKIQKINDGFRLYFNSKTKKFTIVNIYNNFEICKEFTSFFGNIEHDLRFSRIENYNQILKSIDEDNYKYTINNTNKLLSSCQKSATELHQISSRSNTLYKSDIIKIIGESKC